MSVDVLLVTVAGIASEVRERDGDGQVGRCFKRELHHWRS